MGLHSTGLGCSVSGWDKGRRHLWPGDVGRDGMTGIVGFVAPHANRVHRVRTVAPMSGQPPVNHPKMCPAKQPIQPQKT